MKVNRTPSAKAISIALVFCLLIPSTQIFAQEPSDKSQAVQETQKDYYYEGKALATRDYKGTGATVGGLATGVGFGLLGWGVGALVVYSLGAKVPEHYTTGLNTENRIRFEDGYSDKVKQTRRSNYNFSAAIGVVIAVAIVLASSN